MIHVTRPAVAPNKLNNEEAKGLPPARSAAHQGTLIATSLRGYGCAKPPLHSAQLEKCAYCEWRVPKEYQTVDHYRPKSHYWWLAWTWENLLFACVHCNNTHKGSRFPLDNPALQLMPEAPPPGGESPQILDPAGIIDPVDHIVYVLDPLDRWVPTARAGSALGASTIACLGLDEPPLLDEYQFHYRELLRPKFSNVAWAAAHPSKRDLPRFWRQACAFAAPHMVFSALSYDALSSEFNQAFRNLHGLALPVR